MPPSTTYAIYTVTFESFIFQRRQVRIRENFYNVERLPKCIYLISFFFEDSNVMLRAYHKLSVSLEDYRVAIGSFKR